MKYLTNLHKINKFSHSKWIPDIQGALGLPPAYCCSICFCCKPWKIRGYSIRRNWIRIRWMY